MVTFLKAENLLAYTENYFCQSLFNLVHRNVFNFQSTEHLCNWIWLTIFGYSIGTISKWLNSRTWNISKSLRKRYMSSMFINVMKFDLQFFSYTRISIYVILNARRHIFVIIKEMDTARYLVTRRFTLNG